MKIQSVLLTIFTPLILLVTVLAQPLHAESKDAKFVPLFDGKSLDGWSPLPGGEWNVKDGAIIGTSPASERRHGILLTDRRFKDFTVRAKFRVLKGDSGFYFRADKAKGSVGVNGFQVEVDTSQETGGLYETGGRAWVIKPSAEVIKQRKYKAGQWTDLKLTANGRNIEVHINGVKSAELKDDPGRREGHIGLQLHGGQEMHVEFKDIEIKIEE